MCATIVGVGSQPAGQQGGEGGSWGQVAGWGGGGDKERIIPQIEPDIMARSSGARSAQWKGGVQQITDLSGATIGMVGGGKCWEVR